MKQPANSNGFVPRANPASYYVLKTIIVMDKTRVVPVAKRITI